MRDIRYISFVMMFWPLMLCAQTIGVTSFKLLESDLAANTTGTMERDQNGEISALIKVVTTEQGFVFDGGMTGIVKTKQEIGEVWVYVPHGIKKITIKHPQLGVLRDYWFPVSIEKARTYEMVLSTGKVETIVTRTAEKQYVVFQVEPASAVVELDDLPLEVDSEGYAAKSVPYGTYNYRVSCANYHTEAGQVTVNAQGKAEVKVTLRPNFGWIKFTGNSDLTGAQIYVDNGHVGKLPCTTKELKSGVHRVKIVKGMYKTYEQEVTVQDNETTELNVEMVANFAVVTLTTDAEGEIWIDGEMRGKGEWTGRLEIGNYTVEAKRESHKTVSDLLNINTLDTRTIQLKNPIPIYASLQVTSTPMGAKVYIDGVDVGETPLLKDDVLVGNHRVTFKKDGYGVVDKTVDLKEGIENHVSADLPNTQNFNITSNPSGANVSINGEHKGVTPFDITLPYGNHSLQFTKSGYYTENKTIEVNGQSVGVIEQNLSATNMYTVNGVSFTMVDVEGGTFTMGATSEQGSNINPNERPTHEVTLSNYSIGETEVTQELWQAVMGNNPSYFKGDKQCPVEQVCWYDCQEFIKKLNQLTGENFRLPTEAEWEYAARGGKESKGYMYSGSNTLGDVAWYDANSSGTTHVVKTKKPNELGIYDMSGNVWEWCSDRFGFYKSSPQTNPTGGLSSNPNCLLRGGSWFNYDAYCRVSYRGTDSPRYGRNWYGLRLAK